jgi:hypothetical protein
MGQIPAEDWRRKPAWFFAINVTSMTLLLVAVLAYSRDPAPSPLYWSFSFQSVVPLWVPWAGALGGATISLVGIVKHTTDWDPGYWLWHLARPLLGGVSGTIGVLIVVLVIKSVVSSPAATTPGAAPATTQVAYDGPGIAILAVMAFVIGFREETFRHLIERSGRRDPRSRAEHDDRGGGVRAAGRGPRDHGTDGHGHRDRGPEGTARRAHRRGPAPRLEQLTDSAAAGCRRGPARHHGLGHPCRHRLRPGRRGAPRRHRRVHREPPDRLTA